MSVEAATMKKEIKQIVDENREYVLLSQLGEFSKGSGISKDELSETGLPCVRYGEIYTTHDFILKEFKSFINPDIAKQTKRIKQGDILFAGSGETIEEIGKAIAYLKNDEAYAGGDIIILSTNSKVNAECLSYMLEADFVRKQKRRLGQGNSVVHIYPSDLKKIKIPLPPLPEQKAIAAVLSTWDKAIATTTRLIEQKQQRKKWLMQQLLTGKKRLKGFDGVWKEVRLEDVFERVTRKLQENIEVESYTISSKQGFVTQHQKFNRVIAGSSLSNYTLIKMDEFSYNKGNSLTYPFGCIFKFEAERGLIPFVYISFRARKSINPNFFKFYFEYGILERQLKMIISSGARGDGLLNVAPEDFFKLYIKEPSIEEQTAIAAVLQAADKEIQLLQTQLQQLKEQKKGMMQVLLTGKKRLKI